MSSWKHPLPVRRGITRRYFSFSPTLSTSTSALDECPHSPILRLESKWITPDKHLPLCFFYHDGDAEYRFNIHTLDWRDVDPPSFFFFARRAFLCFQRSSVFGRLFLWRGQSNEDGRGQGGGVPKCLHLACVPQAFWHFSLLGPNITDKKLCIWNSLSNDYELCPNPASFLTWHRCCFCILDIWNGSFYFVSLSI